MQDDQKTALANVKTLLFGDESELFHMHDLLGIDHQDLEAVYVSATRQLAANAYVAAAKLLLMLVVLDHDDPKYWRGLAVCAHRLKAYPVAETLYSVTLRLDPNDLTSRVHRAEMMLLAGRKTAAWLEIEVASEELKKHKDAYSMSLLRRAESIAQILRSSGAETATFEK